ncbi:M15 family metallopeptidase [Vibrio sp. ZSDE26]|uniref:M15 family metallopeptidase n=1 Tax=Vibrio amylolyticus TaxID=2847292 RepID=A0A9X1XM39_9VIBR|nr:M15 family metallopeptidase [Vibrio amylolyticus]MCK6265442.1 M15 family metallopeptidase [Vibrio amylolyticus]
MTPEQLTGQTDTHLTKVLIGKKQFQVHREVVRDLIALKDAATKAGFDLCIASGFRSFERQAAIWNGKMSGERAILDSDSQPIDPALLNESQKVNAILRWSALPGASRHHWGTDFDLYDAASVPKGNQIQLEPWEYLTGHQQHFNGWLSAHLAQFGFFLPYREDLGGVAAEPWHISHITQGETCLSSLTVTELAKQLQYQKIIGIKDVLNSLDQIYAQYIANISSVRV